MKIVRTSNYDHESEAERLVAENIEYQIEADLMLFALREDPKRADSDWFEIRPDDYVLWRGMADIVGDPDDTASAARKREDS